MDDLSPELITAIREQFRRRQKYLAARGWPRFRLIAGPLDSLSLKLDPLAAGCRFVGFCHPTPTGLIQLIYRKSSPTAFCHEATEWQRSRHRRIAPNPFAPNEATENPISISMEVRPQNRPKADGRK